MFNRTLPLTRSSAFARTDVLSTQSLEDSHPPHPARRAAASTLSPSLLSDLRRFAEDPVAAELLPVVAASVRHAKSLVLELALDGRAFELALIPRQQLFHAQVDVCELPDRALSRLRLLRVEPNFAVGPMPPRGWCIGSLRPLLWHLALRGPREDLLPELRGRIRCRMTLGMSLNGLPIDGATQRLLQRMRGAPVSIDELLSDTVLGRGAIQRIWNALYLQSGLMVTRS